MQRSLFLAAAAQKWANRLLSQVSERKCERLLCHMTSLVPLLSKDIVTNQSLHAFSVRATVKSWNPSVQSSSSKMKVGSKMTFL